MLDRVAEVGRVLGALQVGFVPGKVLDQVLFAGLEHVESYVAELEKEVAGLERCPEAVFVVPEIVPTGKQARDLGVMVR